MRFVSALGLFLASLLSSCEPQLVDDPIPVAAFQDQILNLSLPEYSALRVDGGIKEIDNIGVRGVFVYRSTGGVYKAYERNCSYHPNEAGSTVNLHVSKLYFVDQYCGSTFNLEDGQPSGGPAWRPLRQYRTDINGSFLTITSEVINY
jgi:hypothetical protein